MIKHTLLTDLGFSGCKDLLHSLCRPDLAPALTAFSLLGSCIEYTFGLKPFMFVALCILLTVELFSGIFAAKLKGRRITSRRMQRFGIMVIIWSTLILVMNALCIQYAGTIEGSVAHYMHSSVIFYIIGVYVKSISENVKTISNNRINMKPLLDKLLKKTK